MQRSLIFAVLAVTIVFTGCAQSGSIWPELGEQLATPSALAVDVAANRLYVVNSNSKVLYDWQQGTFQAYDITMPLAPELIKSTPTQSFSGEVYVDTTKVKAFVPNRFSTDESVEEDMLMEFDLNEAAADFLSFISGTAGKDAYAIDCCYPDDRAWVTTSLGEIQRFDLNDIVNTPPGTLSLDAPLDSGGELKEPVVNHIARHDNLAFLSRENGGVLVVNLDDADVAGAVGVDYYIRDIPNPRGLAIREVYEEDDNGDRVLDDNGDPVIAEVYLYVVGEGNECDDGWCRFLMVLDVTAFFPRTGNTSAVIIDKDLDHTVDGVVIPKPLVGSPIEVGKFPQEVQLSQEYAFVTNQDDDTVSVISLASNSVVATIPVREDPLGGEGDQPFSMALYTNLENVDQYLYVGNVESNTISIIDIPSLTLATLTPVLGSDT